MLDAMKKDILLFYNLSIRLKKKWRKMKMRNEEREGPEPQDFKLTAFCLWAPFRPQKIGKKKKEKSKKNN